MRLRVEIESTHLRDGLAAIVLFVISVGYLTIEWHRRTRA
jgi:hypothetical protein